MENLLKCDGRRFRAMIGDVECEGKVRVEDGAVFLCQNNKDGADCKDKLGYRYSWQVYLLEDGSIDTSCSVKHITLIDSITAAEIEAYKDWQVGDKIKFGDLVWEVIFRSGELVVCKDEDDRASSNYTCDELYDVGWRLVADPEPEDETVELTLDELIKEAAEKRGIPVENIKIKNEGNYERHA